MTASSLLNRAYALLAAAVVALGCLHMAATFRLTSSTPSGKVWFFGSGVAIALAGILNLLNRRYGLAAPGVRAASIGTNVVMAGLTAVGGGVTRASPTARLIMMAVWVSLLVLSVVRSATAPGRDTGPSRNRGGEIR